MDLNVLYKKWATKRNIDWKLIKAHAIVETHEDPSAIGDNGHSIGLMQLQHFHFDPYGYTKEDMLDPDKNIRVGSGLIRYLLKKYKGDRDSSIQAYNVGENAFDKGVRNLIYLTRVLKAYVSIVED